MITPQAVQTVWGVIFVEKKKQTFKIDLEIDLATTLDPSKQLCPIYDATSILEFPVASRQEMGLRVVDNCCEEHIM